MQETIVKSDLESFNNALTSFGNFIDDSTNMQSNIDAFIIASANKKLTGAGYNAMRNKLSTFGSAFQKCNALSDLVSEVTSANSAIISAMGSNSSVTYSKARLRTLNDLLSRLRVLDYFHCNDDATVFERRVAYNKALNEYNKMRDRIKEEIQLLEDVKAAVDAAKGVVSNYTSDTNSSWAFICNISPTSF